MNPRIISACASVFLAAAARAAIPEPDNLLYGSIVLSNQVVTATQSNIVVEARRTLGGSAIASYRMGSDTALGSFYSLRLKLESPGALTDTNASQVGDNLVIVVRDNLGIRAQTNYAIVDRGRIARLDFGAPVDDVDGDGLPDVWEITHFGGTGVNPLLDPDHDGQSNFSEYLAGTDPTNAADAFRVDIGRDGGQTVVSFLARRAQGPGYENLARFYSLQSAGDLTAPAWSGVTGVVNVPGNDQTINYVPTGGGHAFYRGSLSLSPAPADSNGLPDAWEIAWFGSAGQDPNADPDGDRLTTAAEYVAGTNPTNAADVFRISITRNGALNEISFLARKAEGTGYEGSTRHYTLETATDPGLTLWSGVPGIADVVGTNQTVIYQAAPTNSSSFFRARIQLQLP